MDMAHINSWHSSGNASRAVAIPFGLDVSEHSTMQLSVGRARRLRSLRRQLLGIDNYSGPGWEILLHLFDSHLMERRDTVGNVCDGTELPSSTALRWIYRLNESGMINVRDDHLDGRRRFVELSAIGLESMTKYFGGIAPHLLAA